MLRYRRGSFSECCSGLRALGFSVIGLHTHADAKCYSEGTARPRSGRLCFPHLSLATFNYYIGADVLLKGRLLFKKGCAEFGTTISRLSVTVLTVFDQHLDKGSRC